MAAGIEVETLDLGLDEYATHCMPVDGVISNFDQQLEKEWNLNLHNSPPSHPPPPSPLCRKRNRGNTRLSISRDVTLTEIQTKIPT